MKYYEYGKTDKLKYLISLD